MADAQVLREPDICATCQRIRKFVEEPNNRKSITWENNISRRLSDLEQSSREGCVGCGVLHQGCLMQREWPEKVDESSVTITAHQQSLSIGGIHFHNLQGFQGSIGPFGPKLSTVEFEAPLSRRSDSDDCIIKIREWVQECEQTHDGCNRSSFKPTRLLDLGDNSVGADQIKLVEYEPHETSDLPASSEVLPEANTYVALSHCWGKTMQITTTIAKKSERKAGIMISDLSKTFRDAVEITRRLGIRYLWIDSLCIVQDDSEDWAREASNMSKIYLGAYLTIAAVTAPDGSLGIFSDRTDYMRKVVTEGQTGEARMLMRAGHVSILFAAVHRIFTDFVDTRREEVAKSSPLLLRAWTFQERILSRRVVHFAKSEMLFECQEGLRCECAAELRPTGARRMFKDISNSTSPERMLREAWWSMVVHYSYLNLTVRGDVLPALGGVARLFEQTACHHGIDPGEYCAGMWRRWLCQSLLWKPNVPARKVQEGNAFAPSWSWASMAGTPLSAKNLPYGLHFHLGIQAYNSEPTYNDPFGRLSKAELIIEAELLPLLPFNVQTKPFEYSETAYLEADGTTEVHVHFDYEQPSSEKSSNLEERLFCMIIGLTFETVWPYFCGIVLARRVGAGENVYERVGTFDSQGPTATGFGYERTEGEWVKIELKNKIITLV